MQQRLQLRWQLRLNASLHRTLTAVSSVCLVSTTRGRLHSAHRRHTSSVVVWARHQPSRQHDEHSDAESDVILVLPEQEHSVLKRNYAATGANGPKGAKHRRDLPRRFVDRIVEVQLNADAEHVCVGQRAHRVRGDPASDPISGPSGDGTVVLQRQVPATSLAHSALAK